MRVVAAVVAVVGLAVAVAAPVPARASEVYTIARHDTVYSIARRFGVPVSLLIQTNGLRDPSKIRVGQALTIPTPAERVHAQAAPPRPVQGAAARGGPVGVGGPQGGAFAGTAVDAGASTAVHVVQPGDTLYHLAKTHGLTVAELQEANALGSSVAIRVGQALVIPPRGQGPNATGPSVVAAAPALAGGTPAVAPPVGGGDAPAPGAPEQGLPGAPAPVVSGSMHSALLARRVTTDALQYLGTPYVWGGTSRAGVDCSGLVYAIYAPYVPHLPRLSFDQWGAGVAVIPSALTPGDLLFFDTDGSGASHVGIYIGDGRFVHPSSSAGRVVIDQLDEPYYLSHYLGARRVL